MIWTLASLHRASLHRGRSIAHRSIAVAPSSPRDRGPAVEEDPLVDAGGRRLAQGLLALVFAGSGAVKSIGSKAWLIETGQTGVTHYSAGFIRFIALCEIAGAAGLVVPWLTGIAPALTPLAAGGLGGLMIGAARAHGRLAREHRHDPPRHRRERRNQLTNAALLALCLVVAIGRAAALSGLSG